MLGSAFPNSCTIFRRSFSSSWFRIISSKAWNWSCSTCCCFCCVTLCLSFSSSCWMAMFRANSSASFFYKKRIGVRLTLQSGSFTPPEDEAFQGGVSQNVLLLWPDFPTQNPCFPRYLSRRGRVAIPVPLATAYLFFKGSSSPIFPGPFPMTLTKAFSSLPNS